MTDRADAIANACAMYKDGQLGSVRFRATLGAAGCNATTIDELAREHAPDGSDPLDSLRHFQSGLPDATRR